MAGPYHGKDGNLTLSGAVIHLQSWSVNAIGEITEQSAMGDDWAIFDEGLYDFNGTAEGFSKKALDTVALLGEEAACAFIWKDGGETLTGNAIITGVSETVSFDGNGVISYTFEGDDVTGLEVGGSGGSPAATADSFHGKQCHASFNDVSFTKVRSWTCSMVCAVADATAAHASNRGRLKLPGRKSATASIITVSDGTYQATPGDSPLDLVLGRTATADKADGQYEGLAICTGAEAGIDKDGVGIITYSFVFTDQTATAELPNSTLILETTVPE